VNNGHRKCGCRRNSRTISKLCTNYLFTWGYICTTFESVVFTTDLNWFKCMILVSMHGLTGTGSRFPTYSIGELCCEGHQCQSLSTVLTAAEMEKIYSNPFSHAVKLRSLTEGSSKWETSVMGTVKPVCAVSFHCKLLGYYITCYTIGVLRHRQIIANCCNIPVLQETHFKVAHMPPSNKWTKFLHLS